METINLKCPNCQQHFAVPAKVRAPVACPRCAAPVPLPPPVLGRSKGGGVTDFLEEELKPKSGLPMPAAGVQQTMAALGVPQRAPSAWKTVPPELLQQEGVLGVPASFRPHRRGAAAFFADHALILAVFAVALLFFMITTIMTHSILGVSIAGLGIVLVLDGSVASPESLISSGARIERNLLIFGACFALCGVLMALGAWRSQTFQGVERRSAEKWRLFELICGMVVLALLTILITWRVGTVLYDIYDKVHTAVDRVGWKVVDSNRLVRLVFWISLIWFVVVGQAIAVQLNSQRRGFFRLASMAFIGDFVFIIVSGFIFYAALMDFANQQRQLVGPLPMAPSQPQTWNGPVTSMQARAIDPAAQHPSKFVGPAVADDRVSPGTPANIAKLEITDGDNPAAVRNRALLKWTAQTESIEARSGPKIGRRAAVPLSRSYDIVTVAGVHPFVVVRANVAEEGSTFELWDLATGQSRGKIPNDADLSTGLVLSDDGKFLAGIGKGAKSIEVWSFETGKYAARIPIDEKTPPVITFADRETLLGLMPTDNGTSVNLWTIANAKEPRTFLLPPAAGSDGSGRTARQRALGGQIHLEAVSPDGRNLALYSNHKIWLIDLRQGNISGALRVPSANKNDDFWMKPNGLAFSPDGKELVFHCGLSHGSQITSWNTADGTLAAHWQLSHAVEHTWNKSAAILHPADKNFWLLDGEVFVDRRTGRESELKQPGEKHGFRDPLRVLGLADDDHLILASDKMLTTWELPRDANGRLETDKLAIDRDDLPNGMLEKPMQEAVEERMASFRPLEGDELVDASRGYRIAAILEALGNDDEGLAAAVQFYPAAKQPAVVVRWGLGIQSTQLDPMPPSSKLDLQQLTGPVGKAVFDALEKRIKTGAFGQWPERGDERIRTVIPLGIGTRDELLDAARQAGVDGVVVLELNRQILGGKVSPTLKARLSDAAGEPQWSSQQSLAGARLTAQPQNAATLVDAFVNELMTQVDAKYKLQPMPPMKPEQVKDRVDRLTKMKSGDVPTALAELRYYQVKGLLSTDSAIAAYRAWLSAESAKMLATGTSRQRRAAVQQWLDKADRQLTARGAVNAQ